MLGGFAFLAAMLGGSSRPDALQMAFLRPLAALFFIPALWHLRTRQVQEAWLPVLLLAALALWMALQLVPLPPSIWHSLPGRAVVAEIDALLGEADRWRPLSLVPSRTVNALASLAVPASALLLALAYRMRGVHLLLMIASVGVLDAALGLGQVITGRSSPLYFYEVTNRGSPVGVLANENHSAVLSAVSLLAIARLAIGARALEAPQWARFVYVPAYVLVLLAVLVSGSRAGIALAGLAILVTALIAWHAVRSSSSQSRSAHRAESAPRPRLLLGAFAVAIALMVAAFFLLERTPAFEDLLARNAFEDLRARIWPSLTEMMSTFWFLGSGFGSFEEVYHIFEPTALLLPSYVNQAHNDWAQLVIEGGLPAIALLVILLGWIASTIRQLFARGGQSMQRALFWMALIAILAAASIVDYPLRTPIFQVLGVWLLVVLARDRSAAR
ncbi:MAG: O-antigen ligase family protein [Erythrobacter sp.]|nr:MAG: O-antigen ligase family protein [Erythrobacter sp.]